MTLKKHTAINISKDVSYSAEHGKLVIVDQHNKPYEVEYNQSLVWALCERLFPRVDELQYQFTTLPHTIEGNTDDFVIQALTVFENLGFIHLVDKNIEYPIDISKYTHFATTRGGLYAFNQKEYCRLAYGMFFGIDFIGDELLVYEFPHLTTPSWRDEFSDAKKILKPHNGVVHQFTIKGGFANQPSVKFKGLANNCHHLVAKGGELYAVDTESQQIMKVGGSGEVSEYTVFDSDVCYHINSLVNVGSHWLVLRNLSKEDTKSSFGMFDENWRLIETVDLEGWRAHDFLIDKGAELSNLEFWFCDSLNNRIRHFPSYETIEIPPHLLMPCTTRGLSEVKNQFVVGSGRFGVYYEERKAQSMLGSVCFIDKSTKEEVARLLLPETPCCLVQNPWYGNTG
jgi:hypothetical protein